MDEINKILYQTENQPLMISDQPERYLMCKYDGQSFGTSRYHNSEFRLTFVSSDSFWRPTAGKTITQFDTNGRGVLDNLGTSPTPVSFEVDFANDCGFLGLSGPDKYIALGNIKEEDKISVPPSEFAMNEEMDNVNTWQRVTNAKTLIPDYNKLTSAGTAKHDQWGMQLNPSTLGTSDQWHGHAYKRDFDMGAAEREADNFSLRSRVDIADLSGTRNRTMAMLIVVLDENDTPIMSTSIYDVSHDKNELIVTFKVRDGAPGKEKYSKIIHSATIPRLNGFINMEKSGNVFDWIVHNNASTSASTKTRELSLNDIVYLKSSATDIYDWDGRKLNLSPEIKGVPLKVTKHLGEGINGTKGTPNEGRYQLSSTRYNAVEGFFYPDAIKEATTETTEATQPVQVKHTITDNNLAQLRPYKVIVWQAKWGATQPYSQFTLNSVVVQRKYTTDSLELLNTFMAGDKLEIDGETGQIYLNGKLFEGFHDWDSRPITVDGGKTELGAYPSEWAEMPIVKAIYESRWL